MKIVECHMSSNPILAQHFGKEIAYSSGQSASSSSGGDEYDASYGFSRFGSTSYRRITVFSPGNGKAEQGIPVDQGLAAHYGGRDASSLEEEKERAPLGSDGERVDKGNMPQYYREPVRSSGLHIPEIPLSDLMNHSREVLEDARRICDESRRERGIVSSVEEVKQEGAPPREQPSHSETGTGTGTAGQVPTAYYHSSEKSREVEEEKKFDMEELDENKSDPKQIVVSLLSHPEEMVSRRMRRRPADPPCLEGADVPHRMNWQHSRIAERSTPSQNDMPKCPTAVAPMNEGSACSREINSHLTENNMLSVETFTTILEKLTQLINAQQQQQQGVSEPLVAPPTVRHHPTHGPKQVVSPSPCCSPMGSTTTQAPTPLSIQRKVFGSTEKQRPAKFAASPRQSKGSCHIPCYALPTQNWLSKLQKDGEKAANTSSLSTAGMANGSYE